MVFSFPPPLNTGETDPLLTNSTPSTPLVRHAGRNILTRSASEDSELATPLNKPQPSECRSLYTAPRGDRPLNCLDTANFMGHHAGT